MSKRAAGEGTIRRRSDGRWEWRYSDGHDPGTGKQRQHSVYGRTQTEVLAKKRKILAEKERTGRIISPSGLSLESWLYEWVDVYCQHLKPRAIQSYQSHIRTRIAPALGKAKLKNLSQSDVQTFVNDLAAAGLSAKTIANYHGTLHKSLQKAVELDLLKRNPADNIELPKRGKHEMTTLPKSALKSFVNALEGDFYKPFILLALYTGMRQAELLGLTWGAVDFDNNTITVKQQLHLVNGQGYVFGTPKNGKSRVIQLAPQAVQLLHEQRDRQEKWNAESYGVFNNSLDLVFTDQLGHHLAANTIRKHFNAAAESIGMPEMRFHDLRHTFAVFMLQAGVDYKTISETMGHYSVAFTMDTYEHATKEMQKESADKLGSFLDAV